MLWVLREFGQGAEEVDGQYKGFLPVGHTAAVEFRAAEVVEFHPKPFSEAIDVSDFRRVDDEEDVEELGRNFHSIHLRLIQKDEQPATNAIPFCSQLVLHCFNPTNEGS